jgi:signal peptidase I
MANEASGEKGKAASDQRKQDSAVKPGWLIRAWRWLRPIVVVAVVLFALRSTVADWYDVPSGSMEPTIIPGDRIFTNKLAYDLKFPFTRWRLARWSRPARGDIVVFASPEDGTRLVKRVVGLPNETIQLRNDRLFVNSQPASYSRLEDQSITKDMAGDSLPHQFFLETIDSQSHPVMLTAAIFGDIKRDYGPKKLGPDQYFMMGDNRDQSKDSRYIGAVPMDLILGRASTVMISLDRDNWYRPRWGRLLYRLP